MYVYVYIYIYIRTSTLSNCRDVAHTHMYVCMYAYKYLQRLQRGGAHACIGIVHVCIYVYMNTSMYICTHTHIYKYLKRLQCSGAHARIGIVHVCIYVCMNTSMYICTHTHTSTFSACSAAARTHASESCMKFDNTRRPSSLGTTFGCANRRRATRRL